MIDPDPKLGPRIKLADFGFATQAGSGMSMTVSLGARLYMAPELVNGQTHDRAVDVWAVGVLAYYMLSYGRFPFPGITKEVVNSKILTEEPAMDVLASTIPEEARDFIKKCLAKEAANRPSASDLLAADPWMQQVEIGLETGMAAALTQNMARKVDEMGVFQYAVSSFISNILIKSQDARQIGKLFMQMDSDKNGSISREEFAASPLVKQSQEFIEAGSIDELFEKIDTDGSGDISYSEFITAAMDKSMQLSR